ncbi:MAG: sigma-70 family RNA polymerase sigma factor, partial [Pseudonocardiaceae bacterium]
LDAVQMTWLRLAENAHRVQLPERLGGWLATTARRECLHILRQAKSAPNFIDVGPETVADPSVGPEQRVIGADTARTLWTLVGELPPRRRTLLRALFTDNPRPTPKSPVSPESPSARSGPPGRGHCGSCEARSSNTGWGREPGDDDPCRPVPASPDPSSFCPHRSRDPPLLPQRLGDRIETTFCRSGCRKRLAVVRPGPLWTRWARDWA